MLDAVDHILPKNLQLATEECKATLICDARADHDTIKNHAKAWNKNVLLLLECVERFEQAEIIIENIPKYTVVSIGQTKFNTDQLTNLAAKLPEGCAFYFYYDRHYPRIIAAIAGQLKANRILYLSGNPSTPSDIMTAALSHLPQNAALYIGKFAQPNFFKKLKKVYKTIGTDKCCTRVYVHADQKEELDDFNQIMQKTGVEIMNAPIINPIQPPTTNQLDTHPIISDKKRKEVPNEEQVKRQIKKRPLGNAFFSNNISSSPQVQNNNKQGFFNALIAHSSELYEKMNENNLNQASKSPPFSL